MANRGMYQPIVDSLVPHMTTSQIGKSLQGLALRPPRQPLQSNQQYQFIRGELQSRRLLKPGL